MKRKGKKYGGVAAPDGASKSVYAGGGSKVIDETDAKAKGGRVKDKSDGAPMMGGKARLNLGRPGRKSGGRVGANNNPLSTAAGSSNAPGRSASECG